MTTDLLLDSGAYSAKTQMKKIDIDEYIAYIKQNQDVFDKYFNLDVIGNGDKSYQNFLYMRSKGLKPIPVWHAETDPIFLEHYLKVSDYIAIGAISVMSNERTIRSLDSVWADYLTDEDGMPLCKIHGFGLTSIFIMRRYPWWSVDSTSWVQFGRYGVILIPRTRGGKWVYDENPHIVTVSARSPQRSKQGRHFDTYPPGIQEKFLRYIHSVGFKMGKTKFETIRGKLTEIPLELGVSNNHLLRDKINMLYYLRVERDMPEWPWRFKPKTKTGMF